MADFTVVELTAEETHPLRRAVLRNDTPTDVVAFAEDEAAGTTHLGVRNADGIVAVSSWIPRPFLGEPAVQLRGMATAPSIQGRGVGTLLLESGCQRAASIAPLVWARARDSALPFYLRHGFTVEGDGFIDESTQKPHHLIMRRLDEQPLVELGAFMDQAP
ncbi:MAG: GNAT family N-acetyltransferase [Ilumatobacteraceae bacterium]